MVVHEQTHFRQLDAPPAREAPERMQAFVVRHLPFFLLVGLLLGQLLLLSLQITASHDVRLFRVWTAVLFRPFQYGLRASVDGAGHLFGNLSDLWRSQQQNRDLRAQLASAQSQIQQLAAEAAETDRLRRLLDLRDRSESRTLAADVIATSPGENSNVIFIDKGADAGITTDLAVITPAGVVGKVVAVFPSSSQVLLITDPASGVGCLLEKTRVQGVLKGKGHGPCQLYYVTNGEQVLPGDLVVTSGLDQIYPKDLPVGRVLEAADGSLYKKIQVAPSAQLDRLENVLVILKSKDAVPEAHAPLMKAREVSGSSEHGG
jgi:rod shape-determining protein MreC